eukprot:sb/3475549/
MEGRGQGWRGEEGDDSKQPIRTRYLCHVTGYHPIRGGILDEVEPVSWPPSPKVFPLHQTSVPAPTSNPCLLKLFPSPSIESPGLCLLSPEVVPLPVPVRPLSADSRPSTILINSVRCESVCQDVT